MRIRFLIVLVLCLAALTPLSRAALPAMSKETCEAFKKKLQDISALEPSQKPNGLADLTSPEKKPFVPTPNPNSGIDLRDPATKRAFDLGLIGHNGGSGPQQPQNKPQAPYTGDTGAQFGPTDGIHPNDEHAQIQRQVNRIGNLGNLNTINNGVKPPPMPN